MGRKKPQPVFPIAPDARCIRFSFRYLDTTNHKFSLSECDIEFFANLAGMLKTYSSWPVELFRDFNNNDHRHPIDFPETSGRGFPGIDQVQFEYGEDLHFSVSLQHSCIGPYMAYWQKIVFTWYGWTHGTGCSKDPLADRVN